MTTWTGRKVLVTGGAGFIGSHLCELLVKEGADVRTLTHYNSMGALANLSHLDPEVLAEIEVVSGDICDSGCVDAAVQGRHVVFHLAALIGIPYSYVAPRSYVATNVGGTLNVLEACRRNPVERLVHTSTSETYGTARYTPIDEGHPLKGQSPYSASKIGADKMAESYFGSFDLPVVTIRPFNTYGPRQSDRAVIPTIIGQLLRATGELRLGSLSPRRDLTYVTDTARGFLALAEADAVLGEVVNVGSGKAISIGELAQALIDRLAPGTRIVCDESRIRPEGSEVMELLCDNQKAATLANWHPEVSLSEGLAKATEFFRNHFESLQPGRYTV